MSGTDLMSLFGSTGSSGNPELMNSLTDFFNALVASSGGNGEGEGCGGGCGGGGGGGGGSVDTKTVDGEFKVWGDPHVDGAITVDGETSNFSFVTEGGVGDNINILDTDNLDIQMKFDNLDNQEEGITFATEATIKTGGATSTTSDDTEITVDADSDTVTVDGEEIKFEDLENGTCTIHGNTITKEGDTITIKTADGETITIKDQGDYLDTTVDLDEMETSELGGMAGDAGTSNVNDNAEDYVVPTQDSSWASQCCEAASQSTDNQDLIAFLDSLTSLIEMNGYSSSLNA